MQATSPLRTIVTRFGLCAHTAVLCGALMWGGAGASEKLYSWSDEEGKVHYSDVQPPDAAPHGRKELDSGGVVVREVERAKSEEEIAEQRRLAKIEAQRQRREAKQRRFDRNLLDTYDNLETMRRARDTKLEGLQGQANVATGNIANLRQQLGMLLARAAGHERKSEPVPDILQQDIANTQNQIHAGERFIEEKAREQQRVIERFDHDMERFKELTGFKEESAGQ